MKFVQSLWNNQDGQDIAEYAVMLAVILVLVVGTIRLVGSNANNTFSSVAKCDSIVISCSLSARRCLMPSRS